MFAVLKVILFETVTQISRSYNPDVIVDNMKKLRSSEHMKRQTRVKGGVLIIIVKIEFYRIIKVIL